MGSLLSVSWLLFMCSLYASMGAVKVMEDNCDMTQGLFPPIHGGLCPVGTMWMEQFKCCKQCIYCPPGQRKAVEGCLSGCVPCEEGYYSTSSYMSASCQPCTDCDKTGLSTLMPCHRDQDAVCGDCPPGYYNRSKTSLAPKEESQHGTREGCVKCHEHIIAPECSVHFHLFYKAKANNCQHTSWIVTTIILGICTVLGIGIVIVLAVLYYFGKIGWRKSTVEEGIELEDCTRRLTHGPEPKREQGDGSNAEDASLCHQKNISFANEVPCGSSKSEFSQHQASDIDYDEPTSASKPPLGTPASTRSMSMPSLNHITVTVQVPVSIIPELTNAFPNIIHQLATSGVGNINQIRTFVQE